MRRLPLPLVFAIAIVASATVYITVVAEQGGVAVINLTNVQIPSNITLQGLPDAIRFQNIGGKSFCLYIDVPGGLFIDNGGRVVQGPFHIGCFVSYTYPGFNSFTVYFNTTRVSNWYDKGFRVIVPPKHVVIRIERYS